MSEIVFIAKESDPNEGRVAGSIDSVKKLKSLGFDVVVESGAAKGREYPIRTTRRPVHGSARRPMRRPLT